MQVKKALKNYILEKTRKGEVIRLTKIKHQTGKIEITVGAGSGTGKRYSVWEYTKLCRCGEITLAKDDPNIVAEYLIDLCGRDHLKQSLPLWKLK